MLKNMETQQLTGTSATEKTIFDWRVSKEELKKENDDFQ